MIKPIQIIGITWVQDQTQQTVPQEVCLPVSYFVTPCGGQPQIGFIWINNIGLSKTILKYHWHNYPKLGLLLFNAIVLYHMTCHFWNAFWILNVSRVTSWCYHFIHNCLRKSEKKITSSLTVEELNASLLFWIKKTQGYYFFDVQQCLKTQTPVTGALSKLAVFTSSEGILQVGGHIKFSHHFMTKNTQLVTKARSLVNLDSGLLSSDIPPCWA